MSSTNMDDLKLVKTQINGRKCTLEFDNLDTRRAAENNNDAVMASEYYVGQFNVDGQTYKIEADGPPDTCSKARVRKVEQTKSEGSKDDDRDAVAEAPTDSFALAHLPKSGPAGLFEGEVAVQVDAAARAGHARFEADIVSARKAVADTSTAIASLDQLITVVTAAKNAFGAAERLVTPVLDILERSKSVEGLPRVERFNKLWGGYLGTEEQK